MSKHQANNQIVYSKLSFSKSFCGTSHEPREGLWLVKVEQFCPEKL